MSKGEDYTAWFESPIVSVVSKWCWCCEWNPFSPLVAHLWKSGMACSWKWWGGFNVSVRKWLKKYYERLFRCSGMAQKTGCRRNISTCFRQGRQSYMLDVSRCAIRGPLTPCEAKHAGKSTNRLAYLVLLWNKTHPGGEARRMKWEPYTASPGRKWKRLSWELQTEPNGRTQLEQKKKSITWHWKGEGEKSSFSPTNRIRGWIEQLIQPFWD